MIKNNIKQRTGYQTGLARWREDGVVILGDAGRADRDSIYQSDAQLLRVFYYYRHCVVVSSRFMISLVHRNCGQCLYTVLI